MTPPLITEEGRDDEGPGLFLSWQFWAGGLLSIAIWTLIWTAVADFLDAIPTI